MNVSKFLTHIFTIIAILYLSGPTIAGEKCKAVTASLNPDLARRTVLIELGRLPKDKVVQMEFRFSLPVGDIQNELKAGLIESVINRNELKITASTLRDPSRASERLDDNASVIVQGPVEGVRQAVRDLSHKTALRPACTDVRFPFFSVKLSEWLSRPHKPDEAITLEVQVGGKPANSSTALRFKRELEQTGVVARPQINHQGKFAFRIHATPSQIYQIGLMRFVSKIDFVLIPHTQDRRRP